MKKMLILLHLYTNFSYKLMWHHSNKLLRHTFDVFTFLMYAVQNDALMRMTCTYQVIHG